MSSGKGDKASKPAARTRSKVKLPVPGKPIVTPAPPSPWTIIGVDCSTQEDRIGLARGTLDIAGNLRVERVTLGTAGESAAANICQWIAGKPRYIVALDAPLGWPDALSKALLEHQAGAALSVTPEQMFHRDTDHVVQRELGRMPQAVGADRIARTARAALGLLSEIRGIQGNAMPLAWKQARESGAIEVYPVATLAGRGLNRAGYKADSAQGRKAREEILQRLGSEMEIAVTHALMIEDSDQLDALLCVLAGADFARGQCVEPSDRALAKREGFIWFRVTGQGALPFAKKTR
jgi:hypothetical protein